MPTQVNEKRRRYESWLQFIEVGLSHLHFNETKLQKKKEFANAFRKSVSRSHASLVQGVEAGNG